VTGSVKVEVGPITVAYLGPPSSRSRTSPRTARCWSRAAGRPAARAPHGPLWQARSPGRTALRPCRCGRIRRWPGGRRSSDGVCRRRSATGWSAGSPGAWRIGWARRRQGRGGRTSRRLLRTAAEPFRPAQEPDDEALDLLRTIGVPVAKRAAPGTGGGRRRVVATTRIRRMWTRRVW